MASFIRHLSEGGVRSREPLSAYLTLGSYFLLPGDRRDRKETQISVATRNTVSRRAFFLVMAAERRGWVQMEELYLACLVTLDERGSNKVIFLQTCNRVLKRGFSGRSVPTLLLLTLETGNG
jgi:hypothetical protein